MSEQPARHRRLAASLVAVVALALLAVVPALPAAAAAAPATDAHWSVAPADADGPDGRVSLRHVVEPGAEATDRIALTNLGEREAAFAVRAGDGVVGDSGAFDIAPGEPSGSGGWISIGGLDGDTVQVEAGGTVLLPVTIRVPADATPGDHPAGIVTAFSRDTDGLTVTNRIGLRVHLQVAGEIAPALEVADVRTAFTPSWVPFAPGGLRVEMDVVNSGNVRLGAAGSASATAAVDDAAGPDTVELLPGDATTLVLETEMWPLFLVDVDTRAVATAIGDDALTLPAPAVATVPVIAVSWTGVALLVLVAAAAVVVTARIRRRRRQDDVALLADADAADDHPVGVEAGR